MKFLTTLAGRILFGLSMGALGFFLFIKGPKIQALVPAWVPGNSVLWIYITGAFLLIAALFIVFNFRFAGLVSFVLAALILVFIIAVDVPGLAKIETFQIAMMSIFKDLALMGAALGFSGILGKKD